MRVQTKCVGGQGQSFFYTHFGFFYTRLRLYTDQKVIDMNRTIIEWLKIMASIILTIVAMIVLLGVGIVWAIVSSIQLGLKEIKLR